jgi:hypothetical protein
MIEFVASGTPRTVSRAIEAYAQDQRSVAALVVPWESDRETVSMSATSVGGEGWAIEHTNLGTIRLTDLGNDRTRVAADRSASSPDQEPRARLFDQFAEQIARRFQAHDD